MSVDPNVQLMQAEVYSTLNFLVLTYVTASGYPARLLNESRLAERRFFSVAMMLIHPEKYVDSMTG
jgi:hypothetical protein